MRSAAILSLAGIASAACNGYDELCSRKYSNIVQIGAHDSGFVGKSLADDQRVSVSKQLDAGVRFLEAQTHDKNGAIELCHTFCLERDAGPLDGYLGELSKWMKSNPNEVVTLLLTNQDNIGVDKFDKAIDKAGLKPLVFHPKGNLAKSDWPTLGSMIKAGSRLVVFMDFHADTSKVDYIMPEFDHFWETKYGVTDSNFPTCDVDRPSGGDPTKLMGIMNHMLNYAIGDIVIPNQLAAKKTNSLQSINKQVGLCVKQHKVKPSVVLLDWVDEGDVKKAAKMLNGLK